MATESPTHKVYGYMLLRTEKAIQFECWKVDGLSLCNEYGAPRKEWFPLSQCTKMYKTREQSEMDWIDVPEWLLKKKEML